MKARATLRLPSRPGRHPAGALIAAIVLAWGAACASPPDRWAGLERAHPPPADWPFSIHYLGTACFVMRFHDRVICIDPGDFLTNRLSDSAARTVPPCDLILVSHADFDHRNRLGSVPKKPGCVVMGTESLRRAFPELAVETAGRYESDWVSVEALPVTHALRARVDHVGFKITLGGRTLLFMGDGLGPIDSLPREPDLLFVTIGGMAASPESAASLAHALGARHVVPMHWERLLRDDSRVLRLSGLLGDGPSRLLFFPPRSYVP